MTLINNSISDRELKLNPKAPEVFLGFGLGCIITSGIWLAVLLYMVYTVNHNTEATTTEIIATEEITPENKIYTVHEQLTMPDLTEVTDPTTPRKPPMGLTGHDMDGHTWIMYWSNIDFSTMQVTAVNGTTLSVTDKDGLHSFYIKLPLVTYHYDDWRAERALQEKLKLYDHLDCEILYTFPDGDRVAKDVTLSMEHNYVHGEEVVLDLIQHLVDEHLAFRTQEELDEYRETNAKGE